MTALLNVHIVDEKVLTVDALVGQVETLPKILLCLVRNH